ncbi:hypothetical protein Bbelb_203850 [Branchiostoma belcheri]|nr:hypothetical protein Bbelb_203850 [Branchiostoma belcheri]
MGLAPRLNQGHLSRPCGLHLSGLTSRTRPGQDGSPFCGKLSSVSTGDGTIQDASTGQRTGARLLTLRKLPSQVLKLLTHLRNQKQVANSLETFSRGNVTFRSCRIGSRSGVNPVRPAGLVIWRFGVSSSGPFGLDGVQLCERRPAPGEVMELTILFFLCSLTRRRTGPTRGPITACLDKPTVRRCNALTREALHLPPLTAPTPASCCHGYALVVMATYFSLSLCAIANPVTVGRSHVLICSDESSLNAVYIRNRNGGTGSTQGHPKVMFPQTSAPLSLSGDDVPSPAAVRPGN